jgi:hypothetical protein
MNMSLPQIVTPEYTLQLNSIKDPIRYRPYLVREEKIFLTAKESGDPKDIETSIRQVLKNCTFGEIDIDALPSFDMEYLFLQLRGKSVNNIVTVKYQCRNMLRTGDERTDADDTGRCGALNPISVPLDDIEVVVPDEHTNIIAINDDITIEFQYPTIAVMQGVMTGKKDTVAFTSEVLGLCIKSIVETDGTVHEAHDSTPVELQEFIDTLSIQQIERVQAFFNTMPTVTYDTTFVCATCGYTEPLRFEGLQDFFD